MVSSLKKVIRKLNKYVEDKNKRKYKKLEVISQSFKKILFEVILKNY